MQEGRRTSLLQRYYAVCKTCLFLIVKRLFYTSGTSSTRKHGKKGSANVHFVRQIYPSPRHTAKSRETPRMAWIRGTRMTAPLPSPSRGWHRKQPFTSPADPAAGTGTNDSSVPCGFSGKVQWLCAVQAEFVRCRGATTGERLPGWIETQCESRSHQQGVIGTR